MNSRFFVGALATTALLTSFPAHAAVQLSRQFTGAREDEEKTRSLSEHPASQGLTGLREQGRSALRSAKLENKADGRVLMATTTPAVRQLRASGLATTAGRLQAPKLTTHEILHTNLSELLVVKAMTSLGVSHDSLARFAMSQGQDGIQSGVGKVHRLGDSAALSSALNRTRQKPAKRTKRPAAEPNSR